MAVTGLYMFGVLSSIIRYEYNFGVSHLVPNNPKFTTFSNNLLTVFFFGTKGQALHGELTNKSSSQPVS